MEVEQSPSSLILQEGTSSTLRCNFSVTARNIQWFLQNPGGGLVNLFYIASGTKESGRLSAAVDLKERYSTLNIMAAQLQDSATYFCAAEHSGSNTGDAWTQTAAGPAATLFMGQNGSH